MCADVTTNNTTVCLYWWLAGGALDRPNQTQTWTALDMQRNGKFLALDKILIIPTIMRTIYKSMTDCVNKYMR